MTLPPPRRALLTAGGLLAAAAAAPALAQTAAPSGMLGGEPDPRSVLARIRREGRLKVGYAQTAPWFFRDVKAGALAGIYHEVCEEMCRLLDVKAEYQEVSWQDSTVALRRGDFDLFASSLSYTVPRAAVVCFPVPPLWARGQLPIVHKDNAGKYKSWRDFNSPDVTISVNVGTAAEAVLPTYFPRAKVISTTGQILTALEPVRTKRADVFFNGENDVVLYVHRNTWAAVVDQANPFSISPNTWVVRYGDPDWQGFINAFCQYAVSSQLVKLAYDKHMAAALAG